MSSCSTPQAVLSSSVVAVQGDRPTFLTNTQLIGCKSTPRKNVEENTPLSPESKKTTAMQEGTCVHVYTCTFYGVNFYLVVEPILYIILGTSSLDENVCEHKTDECRENGAESAKDDSKMFKV